MKVYSYDDTRINDLAKQSFVYPEEEVLNIEDPWQSEEITNLAYTIAAEFLREFSKLSDIQQRIVSLLISDRHIKTEQISKALGMSTVGVWKNYKVIVKYEPFITLLPQNVCKKERKAFKLKKSIKKKQFS
jgi:hypothetical protein